MELRVVRVTDRFDDACAFYGDVLGWPVTREWDGGRIYGYGDTARVELMRGDPSNVEGVFLSVEVTDVEATLARVTAAGADVVEPMSDKPWGHRSFAVVDPSGIKVVFFQWI